MDAGIALLPAHATVDASLTFWAASPGLMNQVNGTFATLLEGDIRDALEARFRRYGAIYCHA
jgi:hypothetical protein